MTPNPKDLRQAFGRFMTGVTVVTARTETGDFVGFTANSFTSVSLEPPLLLVCPGNHLSSFDAFREAKRFGISILSEGQQEVSNTFASSKADRFALCDWDQPTSDVPLIAGRAAGFVCDMFQQIPAGDHLVLIGCVKHVDYTNQDGLGYGPDGYFTLNKERKAEAPPAPRARASVLLDDGENLFLTQSGDLFTVPVSPEQSPLKTLRSALVSANIDATLSVVYATYDEGRAGRRIVFRGHCDQTPPALISVRIQATGSLATADQAVKSLLQRFANEHKTQNFGFYIGNESTGDVLPLKER